MTERERENIAKVMNSEKICVGSVVVCVVVCTTNSPASQAGGRGFDSYTANPRKVR